MVIAAVKLKTLLGRKIMTNLDSIFKSRDVTLPTKILLVKAMFFPSGHVWMWELDCEESWALKNWFFWTVMLEKTFESPLDWKKIKPVNSKGNQSWISIGSTVAEAGAPNLWPPNVKSWLIRKDPDAGKDWKQKKGLVEDEMVRYYHQLNGHESEQLWEIVEDRWAWCTAVHGVTKSRTWLSSRTTNSTWRNL